MKSLCSTPSATLPSLALALLVLASPACLASDKDPVQEAMDAAKEAASAVSVKDLLDSQNASSTVPGYGSDVSDLTALYNKGQGDLLGPGGIKAEGCLEKDTMDCRAVQVIYDTGTRPSWPESDFDDLLAGRDDVITNLPDRIPGLEGDGEFCETITTVQPALHEYEVCEETSGGSTESCFSGWAEKLEVTTLFQCVNRTQSTKNVTCSRPFVTSIQNYSCVEAPRQTCAVGEVVSVDSRYAYQCETNFFQARTYRCNKVLEVSGVGGCEEGSFHEAEISDDDHLGRDNCDGGDKISLSYACSTDEVPTIRIATNVKGNPDFSFEVKQNDFVEERQFSNCLGRWTGKTRCSGVNCITEVTMDVHYKSGNGYKYSGSLSKTFAYQTYRHDREVDNWRVSCTLEDGYTLEGGK